MRVKEILGIIHRFAPPDLAADWDNCGLQVGSADKSVKKIGLALDATSATVDQAVKSGCDLLLTHHPLIFKPVKNFNLDSELGLIIKKAISADLTIAAAHTNWDSSAAGVAQALADVLELEDRRPLEPAGRDFYKLVVFVPLGYETALRQALFEAGAGVVGAYDNCWFSSAGEGGFRVPDNGRPFAGRPGERARVKESRLEVIVPLSGFERASEAVLKHHPYEEPAFEFHPVKIARPGQGLGLVGSWNPPRDFFSQLARLSVLSGYKWAGPKPGAVSRVALLPGSGGAYLHQAKAAGAEVFITGDVGYHLALEAQSLDVTLLDLGHFETEWPGVVQMFKILSAETERLQIEVTLEVLAQDCPWNYRIGSKDAG